MESIVKTVSYEDAKKIISETSYALLYKIEEIELHEMSEGEDIDALLSECYDARFFDENCEVRLLRESVDGASSAWPDARVIKEPVSKPYAALDKVYTLEEQYREKKEHTRYKQPQKKEETVTVRQYLLPDEDGQMYVQVTRFVRIER